MSVYVDHLTEYPRGTVRGAERVTAWCHMYADSRDELHALADKIGMKRSWFQDCPPHSIPHYDLSRTRRAAALKAGAIEREFLTVADFQKLRLGVPLSTSDAELEKIIKAYLEALDDELLNGAPETRGKKVVGILSKPVDTRKKRR